MKTVKQFIKEALISKKNKIKRNEFKYFPKSTDELHDIIDERMKEKTEIIDVSDIDVSELESIEYTFFDGSSLKKITGLEFWDVSNIISFNDVFCEYESLEDLSGIENWDISNGKNFRSMFEDTHNLAKLDLSKWEFKNCRPEQFRNMFKYSGVDDVIGIENIISIIEKSKAPKLEKPINLIAKGTSLENKYL